MGISNRHTVVPFKAGETKAIEGQRLAKVGYKDTKKAKAKYPSIAVSVPKILSEDIIEFREALIPHVRTMLENAQDGIVKEMYEGAKGFLSEVADSEIDISACIVFLEAESSGGHLKKETVVAWFDESLSDTLFVLIAEKLKFHEITEDNTKVIGEHLASYRSLMSAITGTKASLSDKQIKGLRVALALVPGDEIAERLEKKLDVLQKKNEELAALELVEIGEV